MDTSLLQQMASLYPTPSPKEDRPSKENKFSTIITTTVNSPSKKRKLLIIFGITLFAILVFSHWAYNASDSLFMKLGLDLFTKRGDPKIILIIVHGVLFALLTWLLLIYYR